MNMTPDRFDAVIDAQAAISKILADLEKSTGERIASIELRDTDITTMADKVRKAQTTVVITFDSPSSREWA